LTAFSTRLPRAASGDPAGRHHDLLGGRLVPAAVHGLGDELVHRDGLRVDEPVVVLDPGEVDDLLDQAGEPGRLDQHPAGEPADRLGIVAGVLDRLGEQRQRAHRGLELVRDIGDEVAAHGLDPAGLGEVLDQHQDQLRPERGDPDRDGEDVAAGLAARAPGDVQVRLAYLAVAPGQPGHGQHGVDGDRTTADQAERIGCGAGFDHLVAVVQDDGAGAEHREHGIHTGRQFPRGLLFDSLGGLVPFLLAPPEGERGGEADSEPGDRARSGFGHVQIHAFSVSARW
jgi:hypothetical protein